MTDDGGVVVLFSIAVISLVLRKWNFGSVVEIFGKPALTSDLDGGVGFTVSDIQYRAAARRDGRDGRDDRDGFVCRTKRCIGIGISNRMGPGSGGGRVEGTCY